MATDELIVVVDDDERVCRAIERLLSSEGYRVRTFTRARAYLAAYEQSGPACVVVDIGMPEMDGLSLLLESRATGFEVPAVFITGSAGVETAVRVMKEGASDLLAKPFDDDTLLAAIRHAVADGEQRHASRARRAEVWRRLDTLTVRESQVCALVTSGLLNKQIAVRIGTTEKTVKVHRARAMGKLGARSVAELVRTVDFALAPDAPARIVMTGNRQVKRPKTVDVMLAALSGIPRGTPPSEPRRERPKRNSGGSEQTRPTM